MKRLLAIAALATTPSCALIFQEPPRPYVPRMPPDCGGAGLAIVDVIISALHAGSLIAISNNDSLDDDERTQGYVTNILLGILHLVSAGSGFAWAKRCEESKVEYVREEAAREQREAAARMAPVVAPPVVTPSTPRGWYCYASPTVTSAGDCAREKTTCDRSRESALVGVPDVTACALQEVAQCSGVGDAERCYPTAGVCNERVTMVSGAPCEERK